MRAQLGRTNVQKESSVTQCFNPIRGWHGRLNKKSAEDVVDCTKRALGLAVLGRGVGVGELEKNAMSKEESAIARVVKLLAVVTLQKPNGKREMRRDIALEVDEQSMHIRFCTKREGPNKV